MKSTPATSFKLVLQFGSFPQNQNKLVSIKLDANGISVPNSIVVDQESDGILSIIMETDEDPRAACENSTKTGQDALFNAPRIPSHEYSASFKLASVPMTVVEFCGRARSADDRKEAVRTIACALRGGTDHVKAEQLIAMLERTGGPIRVRLNHQHDVDRVCNELVRSGFRGIQILPDTSKAHQDFLA